jgi:hypothetical protein
MNLTFPLDESRYPVRMRWFLAAAWVLILTKCAVIAWAIERWQVPIRPAWLIVPTLLFAMLATAIWFGAHEED